MNGTSLLTLTVLVVATSVSATVATSRAPSGRRQGTLVDSLRALDSAWARMYTTNDTVLAAAVMADRFVMTGPSGRVKDKATEMGDVRATPGLSLHYFRTSQVRVDVFGGTGIVTGIVEWAYAFQGKEGISRFRYTATYVRGGRLGWQVAGLHMGPVPQQ